MRSASANGRYGTLSPISAHWPDSTVKPRLRRWLHHLGDQARLADARVAADQRGDRMARRRLVQQVRQPGEFGVAAD